MEVPRQHRLVTGGVPTSAKKSTGNERRTDIALALLATASIAGIVPIGRAS